MNIVKKVRNLPQGVKASVVFFSSTLIAKGIAYITTPIYTRLLSSAEYGQVSVFLTWVQIFGVIAMFCLSFGVFNNGMVDYPDKRDEYMFSMLVLSNVITAAFYIVLFALYPLIEKFLGIKFSYIVLMGVLFLVQPAYTFWAARQRFELKYKWLGIWTIVCAVLSPLVAVICILLAGNDGKLDARIYGAEIILIIIYSGFYLLIAVKNKFKVKVKYWKTAFLFNLPLIPHYLSTHLLGSLDRIMIAYLVGNTQAAYYSVAASISSLAVIVWQSINGSLIPYIYEKCKEEDYKSINKITCEILSVFAVVLLLIIMCAPEVVRIMGTEEYMDSVFVIPPIISAVFFQVLYHVFANIVYYYKKPVYVMYGSVLATIFNIITNYVFINAFGYYAAGYTTLACYVLQAVIDYWAMGKVVGKKVLNMKYIITLSLVVIIVSIACNYIYKLFFIRYGIIVTILMICLICRNKILRIVKQTR